MNSTRILELAAIISNSTVTINKLLSTNNLPFPSFDPEYTTSLPPELDTARNTVLDATQELHDLLLSPQDLLRTNASHANLVALHSIQRFNIAHTVPLDSETSFTRIAASCNQNEADIRRLLRHAMTFRVFAEPRKGVVVHTAASRVLMESRMHDWLGATCEETWPAALRTVDAMQKWPGSEEPDQTGFQLANDTEDSIYQVLAKSPERGRRFAGGMAAYNTGKGYEAHHLLDNYDWASLGNGLVVDVGGAGGHISFSIAQRYEHLNFLVQDQETMISDGSSKVPTELTGRVKFMAHDFFTEQPVQANLYYFRWIFHNWSDRYCIKLLTALIPGLRSGARILVHDICLPEVGTIPNWREKLLRTMDIYMLEILNARERDEAEWRDLFQLADERFKFLGVMKPKGSNLALIEAHWEG